ncbi:UNVERIFIED_CONTAM: ribosome biogenesis GTPase [Acetivibrio alkalicellulosi]
MPEGIIVKGIMGFYYVKTEEGVYECKPRGLFRKDSIVPLPGDRVVISVINKDDKIGHIVEILPRKIQLIRPSVSNINQIVTVISVKSPLPDLMLLDKLLVTAKKKGIEVAIIVNKIDLDEKDQHKIFTDSYKVTGFRVMSLCSLKGIGFEKLEDVLAGKITVFAGQSGVGKSTILNRIMDSYIMETGNISNKNDRGKHTTRHAELIELKTGGFVVDTPGFSSFELSDIDKNELKTYYPEFEPYVDRCKFGGCSHINEPKCGVKDALERGQLDLGRYERYVELYKTLENKERRRYS